jgi:NhaA family Na+:H+ antiporter
MAGSHPPLPPLRPRPIDRLLEPVQEFARVEAAGGILLLACTVVALIWANSSWAQSYHDLWHIPIALGIGSFRISESLAHWVNDGLMAVFFFVVGLEIKRELLAGELASLRQAAIPIAAAIGGMVVPALLYVGANLFGGGEGMKGWAIPAATDIAFALGVMALLGKRVPLSLKVFLTAVAIVDDIGAVLIIALFYTGDVSWVALGVAAGILVLLIAANLMHVRSPVVYGILGFGLWAAFHESGVHATIAGVLLAFTIPSRFRIRGAEFIAFGRRMLDEFEQRGGNEDDIMSNPDRQARVLAMEIACEHVQTPLQRLEHKLHPLVSFFIMPVFALANAGVPLGEGIGVALRSPVSWGIVLGLVVGKQVGVFACTWIAVRSGLGRLPAQTNWRQIHAAGCLAGIGFTMSLFIASLGFGEGALLEEAKIGILGASLISGILGLILLRASSAAPGSGQA